MEAAVIPLPTYALHVCTGCPLRNATDHVKKDSSSAIEHVGLSPTETKVVKLLAEGLSNPQIAARTFNSEQTIKYHVTNIVRKLNHSGHKTENRTQVALWAWRNGLAE